VRVLLDHEHGDALRARDLVQTPEELTREHRRQPERRLVEQQQPWPRHDRPRDREHLLLATAEASSFLVRAFV
jgi:hypothetical protein